MAWVPYNLSFKILKSRGGKVKVNIKNMDFEGCLLANNFLLLDLYRFNSKTISKNEYSLKIKTHTHIYLAYSFLLTTQTSK